MARVYTPKDGYQIMTVLGRLATGQQSISVVNMSDFISAGETVLGTGKENVYNALGILIGRTLVAARAYKEKLALMNAIDTGSYTNRLRKISFYAKDPIPSGFFNTDIFTNLADGYDGGDNGGASTKSQWEQHQAMPLEMNFGGSTVWQHCLTMYEEQINAAFRDPQELAAFVAGQVTEHENDIATTREAFNRMTLLSKIGATYAYDAGGVSNQVVNLTAAYNTFFGTSYTSAQLRSTYLKSFLEFMTATIKQYSDFLTERTKNFHVALTKTVGGVSYSILRHVPKDRQRLYLFRPLIRFSEAIVMPEIFSPEYLTMDQYEGVDFWQSNYDDTERPQVKVKTAILNTVTGEQTASADIEIPFVVGLLTDVDGMMNDFAFERSLSTGLNARKGYRNVWLSFARNSINDPTESAVLFTMED
jgi:hypothetical protein